MNRESFIFYRSFYSAISALPDEQQLSLYRAIVERALNGIEPELFGTVKGMYELIKPQIEANERKYLNGCKGAEFGKLGGRPPKNPTETPKKPLTYPTETPNDNVNVNDNDNENVNENFNVNVLSPEEDSIFDEKQKKGTYGSEFQKVRLTNDEYGKLVERLGKDSATDYIDRLDGWLAEGHRKKSHYATILNWWRKDNNEPKETTSPQNFVPSRQNIVKDSNSFKPSRR